MKIETSNTAVNVNTIMSTVTLTINELAPGFPTVIAKGEVVGSNGAEGEVCDWYFEMPSKPTMTTQEIDMALKVMLPEEDYKSLINSIESEMLNEASKAVSKALNPTPECIDTKTSQAQIIREFISGIDLADIIRRTLLDMHIAENAEINIQQQGFGGSSFEVEVNVDEWDIAREVTNELVSTFDNMLEEMEEKSAQ